MLPARPLPRPLRAPLLFAALLAAALIACGDDDGTTPDDDDGPFTGTIRVLDNSFSPRNVTIALGDSVTWRWDGNMSHSVTQGTTPNASQDPIRLFDSGEQTSGTFGFRFTNAGTVPYFCRPHFSADMKGTITVTP